MKDNSGAAVTFSITYTNNDSVVVIQPGAALKPLTQYGFGLTTSLQSQQKIFLPTESDYQLITAIDSTDKFPRISDSALLDLVQKQTLAYFWDFGHPVSGLARERTSSGDIVTTGGSGFGIMAMLAGIQRGFITRAQGFARISTIVSFLTNNCTRYHGAFSHWINGATGATVPFSTHDDGGDIVETSYLMQGLLCARQYFNSTTDSGEIKLRTAINTLYTAVDYNWYRQAGQNVLYWNWSPDYGWAINFPVSGWNEALITYVLAASAPTNPIPKVVYDNGWARNAAMVNGKTFYGITLPLGPDEGGPLFFAHYSFLGMDPRGLQDAYANYYTQDTAHARINYLYCVSNPKSFYGYSTLCWGLTASDEPGGYSAHAPDNDDGVITPTAAIASLPYTPTESMNALRFFYYTLGDKCWGQYGFTDAFSLSKLWFDNDRLAIDQGPEIVMIENYRSGLLWNLFMSCPEVQQGMKNLGFTSPHF
ncbi:hypothetical protein GCM10011511_39160 [Puia dinghuensis]|uniref:Glycoamylase-like domain-containing protein n=1 Tax=Puia dinghuensis TaxID=1792502 RepID=A0A8J2UGA7_9BACT|nr:hypothetical protein GCM10011511_39160 [Puia dinghuensis]